MTRLRSLIKEVLSTPPKKKDCNCGCGGCGKKSPVLTESKTKTTISEGLQYHIDKKVPLHESVYRIGSEKHFALINEARALWVRELINVSEDDQAILETHLGNFGLYEGEKVPLDLPMVSEEVDKDDLKNAKEKLSNAYQILGKETGQTRKGDKFLQINYIPKSSPQTQNPEFVKVFYDNDEDLKGLDLPMVNEEEGVPHYTKDGKEWKGKVHKMPDGTLMTQNPHNEDSEELFHKEDLNEDLYDKFLDDPQNPKGRAKAIISKFIKQYGEDASGMAVDRFAKQNNLKPEEKYILQYITKNDISISSKPGGPDFSALSEAKKKAKSKKKDPPLNKPKRGGSKAYYVYVRDPKTKKIKKVSFGSGGLRAKIKNKQARNAFAARHNCKNKKDRTKAGYWSCNLPRYAEQLGLGSKMNTFW